MNSKKLYSHLKHSFNTGSSSTVLFVLLFSLFALGLSTFTLYRLSAQEAAQATLSLQKPDLVLFMQSNDAKSAKLAIERAIVLKNNNAVKHIEIVFGGDGVIPVVRADEELIARLKYAQSIGVTLSGCHAGLTKNNLTDSALPDFITVFPYGVVHTLDLVAQGYTVIQS